MHKVENTMTHHNFSTSYMIMNSFGIATCVFFRLFREQLNQRIIPYALEKGIVKIMSKSTWVNGLVKRFIALFSL